MLRAQQHAAAAWRAAAAVHPVLGAARGPARVACVRAHARTWYSNTQPALRGPPNPVVLARLFKSSAGRLPNPSAGTFP